MEQKDQNDNQLSAKKEMRLHIMVFAIVSEISWSDASLWKPIMDVRRGRKPVKTSSIIHREEVLIFTGARFRNFYKSTVQSIGHLITMGYSSLFIARLATDGVVLNYF